MGSDSLFHEWGNMRWLLAAGFLLFFGPCVLRAQGAWGASDYFVLGIGASAGVPASSNAATQLNVGTGGEALAGYALDDHLSIGLVGGLESSSLQFKLGNSIASELEAEGLTPAEVASLNVGVSGEMNYVPLMVQVRFVMDGRTVRPYALLGIGAAFNTGNVNIGMNSNGQTLAITESIKETDFLLAPGLGLLFPGDRSDVFLQARVDLDYTTSGFTDIFYYTISTNGGSASGSGYANLTGDSPTIYLRFEAGLDYDL